MNASRRKGHSMWKAVIPELTDETNGKSEEDAALLGEKNIMLTRKLQESEKGVRGVLGITVKEVSIDSGALSLQDSVDRQSLYLTRQIGDRFKFEELKHFPVNVVPNRSHPFNAIRIDVLACNSENHETTIGSLLFHLHDVIKGSPVSSEFPLCGDHLLIGHISLELTFNYGIFGYGISPQLADADVSSSEENIQYSLLPRIFPGAEYCEPNDMIIRSQAVSHPNFIPFANRVYLGYGKDLKNQLEYLRERSELKPSFMLSMPKLENARKKYFSTNDRATRLLYLQTYLQSSHHRQEDMPLPVSDFKNDEFPKKEYIRYLAPIIAEPDSEMAKQLEKFEGNTKTNRN